LKPVLIDGVNTTGKSEGFLNIDRKADSNSISNVTG
jgi:hypothetical protein